MMRGGPESLVRLRAVVRGAVQGVGFRPFVHRLAGELGLAGWVVNTGEGVVVEVEGSQVRLGEFLTRIERDRPAHSFVQSLEPSWLPPVGFDSFEIRPSPPGGPRSALVLPDIATCPECLAEILDPSDRRHRYPFANCTHCGPRFSIIERLPYDRPHTSMKGFEMCGACRAEYEDPENRRFHAQPNACPDCGPQLALWTEKGEPISERDDALAGAVEALRGGRIVAVKGLGGFHLMVRADDPDAVGRLRMLKGREEKPFALMAPTLAAAREICRVSDLEERLLLSGEAPIVLMERRREGDGAGMGRRRASGLAGLSNLGMENGDGAGMPTLLEGVMLPSNPLHHLMLHDLGVPVVATSGNLGDEPICTDEHEALERLGEIADLFLVHNRPIVRHVDDSIVRVLMGREMVMRRARGYAPLPVPMPGDAPDAAPTLAVGPHLKNTVAVAGRGRVFVSQHLGNLETDAACRAFEAAGRDLQQLFDLPAERVVCDLHPDYVSTRFAESSGLPVLRVQHHYAHALACMAENGLGPPVFAVVWDGTGWGPDGTIWGGEFLVVNERGGAGGFERFARFRPFPLPGGDAAAREPRRALAGALWEIGEFPRARPMFFDTEFRLLERMLQRGVNTVATSSAGRLVDAAAALLGVRRVSTYEAQAAMELELLASEAKPTPGEGIDDGAGKPDAAGADGDRPHAVDWAPWLREIIDGMASGQSTGEMAAAFHGRMVEAAIGTAQRAGFERVVLSGGCFQNRLLLEGVVSGLRAAGFQPFWHQRVPPNDGGISLGQAMAAQQ